MGGSGHARFRSRDFKHLFLRRGAPGGQAQADAKKAAVAALIEALKDANERVRTHSESALCNLDHDAVPALLELLQNKDRDLRARAAKILGSMGTHGRRHEQALPALTKALKDDDTEVRRWAAYAISQIVVPSR